MKNIIETFGPNEHGRDFVIGDLHGSLTCFENLLVNLNFDEAADRMFSVGDLVGRGPDSLGALRLLYKPWFHCVLSNHEQMMYEAFNDGYIGQFWFQNGGHWGMEAINTARALKAKRAPIISDADAALFDLLVKVGELPFLITINHKNGKRFHIIHAELPPGHEVTDTILADPEQVHELATKQTLDGDCFLCGRHHFYSFYKADLSNRGKVLRTVANNSRLSQFNDELSHIISGHTILQRPMTLIGQTNIDTCAYGSYSVSQPGGYSSKGPKWAALTCICLDDWSFMQATETEFRTCVPFIITRSDLR